eukprot:CAMPEP_0184404316 /NCGR_PEP_ID=MMETSP0007-20130409/85873_1 /TAXON_ID=97485 /ORGANISM="Prymnesium parvum, Strain Texoma1" /LENGTH=68 /DNA_ID=CAMNT_0026760459 /DNA_START=1353 /DNA_END=1556 /DNA_ORIENTATION=+
MAAAEKRSSPKAVHSSCWSSAKTSRLYFERSEFLMLSALSSSEAEKRLEIELTLRGRDWRRSSPSIWT